MAVRITSILLRVGAQRTLEGAALGSGVMHNLLLGLGFCVWRDKCSVSLCV
jgi:hypothetical protein